MGSFDEWKSLRMSPRLSRRVRGTAPFLISPVPGPGLPPLFPLTNTISSVARAGASFIA